jgi:hypothetical protein
MMAWSLWMTPTFAAPPGEPTSSKNSTFGGVILGPLLRHVIFVVDRLDRAYRLARTAVDALVGVNVEHAVALVDAVDGTFVDARSVFDVHTREGDDVSHGRVGPFDSGLGPSLSRENVPKFGHASATPAITSDP